MKILFKEVTEEGIVSTDTGTIFESIMLSLKTILQEEAHLLEKIEPPSLKDDIIEHFMMNGITSYDMASAISETTKMPLYYQAESEDLVVMTEEKAIIIDDIAYMVNPFSGSRIDSMRVKKDAGFLAYNSIGVIPSDQFDLEKEKNSDMLLEEIIQLSKTEESQEEAKAAFTTIILDALKSHASDIHINPGQEDEANIYFRVEGSLERKYYENIKITNGIFMALIYIIHYEAGKDYLETIPQSAKFVFSLGFRNIYLRMEVVPTKVGIDVLPKITLRILGLDSNLADISKLGFTSEDIAVFKESSNRENGIIIVTGPTGSGKSTTLYSLLNYVKKRYPEKSIFTVEDPVEMAVDRTTQIEVNEKAGMTFNVALRSILRLDPDVIMVGEIRDLETAQMAIRASLTGHLVLTTLHTNSAIGAVARLLDLGIEHSLLANSLACLTAQRLVKKVCSVCSTPTVFSEEEDWQVYAEYFAETEQLLKASQSGCMECNNGYSGRITINEILGIDNSKIGNDVMADIKKNFQKSTLRDDALSKIRTWETTIEAVQAILMK